MNVARQLVIYCLIFLLASQIQAKVSFVEIMPPLPWVPSCAPDFVRANMHFRFERTLCMGTLQSKNMEVKDENARSYANKECF
jgi:hypothetical protein